jgi:hypothetical protein
VSAVAPAGSDGGMQRERDAAKPTPEELRETAASEGLMASEEETDPEFEDDAAAAEEPVGDDS